MKLVKNEDQHEKLPDPWERLKGEPSLWFGRFRTFLSLGSERSIRSTHAAGWVRRQSELGFDTNCTPPSASSAWNRKARQFRWLERADAYDDYLYNKSSEVWERRGLESRERMWRIMDEGMSVVLRMLQNRALIHDSKLGDASRLLSVMSSLARRIAPYRGQLRSDRIPIITTIEEAKELLDRELGELI